MPLANCNVSTFVTFHVTVPVLQHPVPLCDDDDVDGDVLREADGGAEVAGEGDLEGRHGFYFFLIIRCNF